jgi:hypothetical protein
MRWRIQLNARNQRTLFFVTAMIFLLAEPVVAQNMQTSNPSSASRVNIAAPAVSPKFPPEETLGLFAFDWSNSTPITSEISAGSTVHFPQHGTVPPSRTGTDSLAALWKNYNTAVEYVSLWRNEDVQLLKPLTVDADGTVEVVTATRYEITSPLYGDTWVTIVPELQTACRKFTGDIAMQMRELLGLPPDHQIPNIFVMRVKAAEVFRPTPDPTPWTLCPCGNPTQRVCKFDPPVQCGNSFPPDVAVSHQQWIVNATVSMRQMPGGFPWTHLGYTYNWAPGADHYGASEYIVRKGAQVKWNRKLHQKNIAGHNRYDSPNKARFR